ncbi:MAG: ECF-type sigma factor [Gemmatimonadales bacterium]
MPAEHASAALDGLVPSLYNQLRARAQSRLHFAPGEHSLNTTGLVHEAYLRLANSPDQQFIDHDHFLAIASRVMRNVLVDHARARASQKRTAGAHRVDLDEALVAVEVDLDTVLDLDDALKSLEEFNPRQSEIIECRYFGGLSLEETASALNVSPTTVKRELRLARAWLAADLTKRSR